MRIKALLALVLWSAMLSFAHSACAFEVTEPIEGVYVHWGAQVDAAPDNLGDIANIGFIVGSKGVAVIDTGGSPAVGAQLRQAIAKVTSLPVLYVINTHVHPDHMMGNPAFEGATFVGHQMLPAADAARGPYYMKGWNAQVGETASKGAKVIAPTVTAQPELKLDLGNRVLTLHAWSTAHTDNDLTVYDEKTGTLWTGDLLFRERIPVIDGSVKGWLAVLDEIAKIPAKRAVPGHGTLVTDWPADLKDERRYLEAVVRDVRAIIAKHGTIEQAIQTVGISEVGRWLLFDAFHRRNITAAFAELEWE